jgi:hypothetical protein
VSALRSLWTNGTIRLHADFCHSQIIDIAYSSEDGRLAGFSDL